MKKFLSVLLAALLLLSLAACGKKSGGEAEVITMPATPMPENTPVPTPEPTPPPPVTEAAGVSGEGISWSFTDDTLTISGSGVMEDHEPFGAPWDTEGASIRVKKLVVGEGVRYIGANAFSACVNLEAVTLPSTLERIGANAFTDCISLGTIELPESLFAIDDYAFMGSGLTSVTLPKGLAVLGTNVFSLCVLMKSATVSDRLAVMGESCFGGCDQLGSITCPAGEVEAILRRWGYGDYLNVVASGNTPAVWSGKSGALQWRIEGGTLTLSGAGEMPNYTAAGAHAAPWSVLSPLVTGIHVESGVRLIGDYAFWSCGRAAKLTLPEGLESIGECAFGGCDALTSVTLPASLKTIGDGAFSGCASLSAVSFPEGLETIGVDAFRFCPALASVTLPASVKTAENGVFDETTIVNR